MIVIIVHVRSRIKVLLLRVLLQLVSVCSLVQKITAGRSVVCTVLEQRMNSGGRHAQILNNGLNLLGILKLTKYNSK